MSDSVRPHRRQPTRLPRPWNSPGKSTGVGCHCLLRYYCRNNFKAENQLIYLLRSTSDAILRLLLYHSHNTDRFNFLPFPIFSPGNLRFLQSLNSTFTLWQDFKVTTLKSLPNSASDDLTHSANLVYPTALGLALCPEPSISRDQMLNSDSTIS